MGTMGEGNSLERRLLLGQLLSEIEARVREIVREELVNYEVNKEQEKLLLLRQEFEKWQNDREDRKYEEDKRLSQLGFSQLFEPFLQKKGS